MKDDKKILSKDELKEKLDTLGEEIKYRVAEAKKADASIASAHKMDISELMKSYREMKEAYDRMLRTEAESLQLEDILASLAEEKEEDPKKVEEREKLRVQKEEEAKKKRELEERDKLRIKQQQLKIKNNNFCLAI